MKNNLFGVTRMSVYFGKYKKTRTNGYQTWCKVVMHCSKYVTNPIDGSMYMRTADVVAVPIWLSDVAAEEMVTIAETVGQKMAAADNKEGKSQAYVLAGDNIPQQYRFAFTEDATLVEDYIQFDGMCRKVDVNGEPIIGADNKFITANGVKVTYWASDDIKPGSRFSKESRVARTMKEWKPIIANTPSKLDMDNNTTSVEDTGRNAG